MHSEPKIILYGHSTCPQLPPVKMLLDQNKIDYEYINIYKSLEARERVKAINNGYESVPTLEFTDGSTLTEPALGDLRRKLEALGYDVKISPLVWFMDKWGILLLIAALIFALLRGFGVF